MENENTIKKPMSTWEKVKECISTVITIVLVCAFLFYGYQVFSGQQAFIFGHRGAVVLSGSMEPYMMTHSLCLNKQLTSPDQVEIGDVITYELDYEDGTSALITHRVIAISDGLYFFKGDNNRVEDGYGVPYERLVSEVTFVWNGAVPIVNFAMWLLEQWETDMTGKVICISAAVGLVCIYQFICMLCSMLWGLIAGKRKAEDGDEESAEKMAETNEDCTLVSESLKTAEESSNLDTGTVSAVDENIKTEVTVSED